MDKERENENKKEKMETVQRWLRSSWAWIHLTVVPRDRFNDFFKPQRLAHEVNKMKVRKETVKKDTVKIMMKSRKKKIVRKLVTNRPLDLIFIYFF